MRWQSIFIAIFLLIQLVAPLDYYACRDDRYDERFAWRMFSPERMASCVPVFKVGDGSRTTRVNLPREFHQVWVRTARRGRMDVLGRMGVELCQRNPGQAVRLELKCKEVDGTLATRTEGHDICMFGEVL